MNLKILGMLQIKGQKRRAGLLALAAYAFAIVAGEANASTGVGDTFPSLSGAGLIGGTLPVTVGKVVIVDFWASWCAPCKASFPAYGRLNSEFRSAGLVIVAISVDLDKESYLSFASRYNPNFYVALDPAQRLVGAVSVPTMPTSYLLDRTGRVRYVHAGFHGAGTEQEIRSELVNLLSEKSP